MLRVYKKMAFSLDYNSIYFLACSKQRDQSIFPESHPEWGQAGEVHTTQEQRHRAGQGDHQRGRRGGKV